MVGYFKALTNVNDEHERFPLNVSVVIDRSGSMGGQKLRSTKEAVIYFLKQLNENDIVSVVAYESEVEVIISPQKVKNVKEMIKKIEKISEAGSTFLSGGMDRGFSLINSVRDTMTNEKYVHRMILLSDGLANEGIIDEQALISIARKQSEKNNISVSTIGVGGDYNETLMTEMAVQGNGNYYFVATPTDIPEIFKTELEGMETILAKNTVLTVTFPPEAVSLRQLYFYNYALIDNTITIQLNDVFSDEEKAFIFEFDVVDGYSGDIKFKANLSYNNALDSLKPVSETKEFNITETKSKSDFDKSFLEFGSLAQAFKISTYKYELATTAADDGKYNEAESLLASAKEAAMNYKERFRDHPFLEDILDGIKEYEKDLKEMQKAPNKRKNLYSRNKRYNIHKWKGRYKY
jgi:Ca-activated chloride channel family protein